MRLRVLSVPLCLGLSFLWSCGGSKATSTPPGMLNAQGGKGGSSGASGGGTAGTSLGLGGSPVGGGGTSNLLGGGGTMTTMTGPGGETPMAQGYDVLPHEDQVISWTAGQPAPTVLFEAYDNGQPYKASWSVDRLDIGGVPVGLSPTATFTATTSAFGVATLTTSFSGGPTLTRHITVKVSLSQNGPTMAMSQQQLVVSSAAQLVKAGGIGGVGGEGLGPTVTDMPTLAALKTPMSPGGVQLGFLYPYDATVWPRGMLPPLLMWTSSMQDADAIKISLDTTSGAFHWDGTFGKPTVDTMSMQPFVRQQIPPDVWQLATSSAGGTTLTGKVDQLTVSLVVAKGGVGYGPIQETWTVAPAALTGTVYYNTYGTALTSHGGAVLGIKPGVPNPSVIAGQNECNVCHSVSDDGSRMIAAHANYNNSFLVDLKTMQTFDLTAPDAYFWGGLSSDGSRMLLGSGTAYEQPQTSEVTFSTTTLGDPMATAATGFPMMFQGGSPRYSPSGAHVAFELLYGGVGGPQDLVVMDRSSSDVFGNPRTLAPGMPGSNIIYGFPEFFPADDGVVFHRGMINCMDGVRYSTRRCDGLPVGTVGNQAQIWWSDLATKTPHPLNNLNGMHADGSNALPQGPNNHGSDIDLNYEPTVIPLPVGGYIWVVFTSRRLYGNLATIDPWNSHPGGDYDPTNYAQVTPKKLWVAAVDLNAQGGTDPSHPAFYLPGQELMAGNMAGVWALDPCKADGSSCTSGDQCCNGFCDPNAAGMNVCGPKQSNQCAKEQEHCMTAADCCNPMDQCINNFCSIVAPHVN